MALLAGVAYLALYAAAWLVVKVTTISAAAAACSGEHLTFASLLGDARASLARAAVAYACGFAMIPPCIAGVFLLTVPVALLWHHSYPLWLVKLGALPPLVGVVFCIYLDVVFDMAVVVSVAKKKKADHQVSVARAWARGGSCAAPRRGLCSSPW